jgi:hypothetical protein
MRGLGHLNDPQSKKYAMNRGAACLEAKAAPLTTIEG